MGKIGPEPAPAFRPREFRPREDCAWPADWNARPAWRSLFVAICGRHGEQAAIQIMRGQDRRTNADLDAWRRLGVR